MGKRSFINTYLNSPIIINRRDRFYLRLLETRAGISVDAHEYRGEFHTIKRFLTGAGAREIECLDPSEYPMVRTFFSETTGSQAAKDATAVAVSLSSHASAGLSRWGLPWGIGYFPPDFSDLTKGLIPFLSVAIEIEKVVNDLATSRSKGDLGVREVQLSRSTVISDSFVSLIVPKYHNVSYLVSYDQLLMLKDMYRVQFNTLIAARVVYRSPTLESSIVEIIKWFEQCIVRYRNRGYGVGKQVESLAKTNISRVAGRMDCDGDSHRDLLEVVRNKERSLGGRAPFQADLLESILKREHSVPEAVELFGLQKICGHPLIDPSAGGESVREEARAIDPRNYRHVQDLRNSFCRLYVEGYLSNKKEWPPLSAEEDGARTELWRLYSLNETNLKSHPYPLTDWDHITFKKHLEFDYYPNYLDVMDDKTLSFYRSDCNCTWDRSVKPKSSKRLLIEMLRRGDTDLREIIEQVRHGDIPFDWLIVSLYPKEREFKEAARMFGMMVYEMRAYFAVTEANLAEYVFPHIPPQTMTLGRLEILELFHEVTQPTGLSEYIRLFLEVDLTRWNLHWHPEVVDPVGYTLEDMFGLPGAFTVIHHFFRKCVMLVRTSECEPPHVSLATTPETSAYCPESSLMWFNHEVGIEGLFQKGWTLCTYPMMDIALRSFGLRYYQIGQADNQTVMAFVKVPGSCDPDEFVRSLTADIKASIQESCSRVGQLVKTDETLSSTSVITYSKNVYIDGVEYFTSCKAFSRMMPHSSADFPSVSASVGALSSQAQAGAESLKLPTLGYFLYCFHAALYFTCLKNTKPVEASIVTPRTIAEMDFNMIWALLVFPGSLGGLETSTVTSFLYKGGADPLSKDYAHLMLMQGRSPLVRRWIFALHSGEWMERAPSREALFTDPYALPLTRGSSPIQAVERISRESVYTLSCNQDIKDLMAADVSAYKKDLVRSLETMSPLNPIIASDILGWSVVGASQTIGKMFTATRTIQDLISKDDEVDPVGLILASGLSHLMETVRKIRSLPYIERRVLDIYRDIERLRSFWVKETEINLVGVTAYTPWDQKVDVSLLPPAHQGVRGVLSNNIGKDASWRRGPHTPYLGRQTREHRSSHGYRIVTSTAPSRAIKRLSDIMMQPGVDSSLKQMIQHVAFTRGDIDLLKTTPYLGSYYGGEIAHRYSSRLGVRSANGLGSMSIASNALISTNSAAPLSGGEDDYPRMVQEDMVACIGVLQISSHCSDLQNFVTICYDEKQLIQLPDSFLYCSFLSIPKPLVLATNKLVYDPVVALELTAGLTPSALCRPIACSPRSAFLVPYATRRLFSRALDVGHAALALADHSGSNLRVIIGLPELRGITLSHCISLASLEIASASIKGVFLKNLGNPRWSLLPAIVAMSSAFASKIALLAKSPYMAEDPLVARYGGAGDPGYVPTSLTLQSRISSEMSSLSSRLLLDLQSELYTGKIILFQDEHAGSTSRALVRFFSTAVWRSVQIGEITREHGFSLVKHHVRSCTMYQLREEDKLGALYLLFHKIHSWSAEHGCPLLTDACRSIIQGKAVFSVTIPASEAIRLARSMTVVSSELGRLGLPTMLIDCPQPHLDKNLTPLLKDVLFDSPEWRLKSNSLDSDFFSIKRLSGRIFGVNGTVAYSYYPLRSLFHNRLVLIVGSGLGAAAYIALESGSVGVYGLDLTRDLVDGYGLDMPPCPSVVRRSKNWKLFTRIMGGPLGGGDLNHLETQTLLRRTLGPGALVVLDIKLFTGWDLVAAVNSIVNIWGTVEVLVRWISSLDKAKYIVALCHLSFIGCQSYLISSSDNMCELIVHATVTTPVEWRSGDSKLVHIPETNIVPFPRLEQTSLDRQDLTTALVGPIQLLTTTNQLDVAARMAQLLRDSTGPLDHRFTYAQWSSILTGILCSSILESGNPHASLLDVIRKDVIEIIHGERVLTISLNKERRKVLTKQLPRLLAPYPSPP